jgi:hypothetical protein
MAATAIDATVSSRPSGRLHEHRFFCSISVLVALVVFIGFARTYFLSSWFHARPLPAPIIHIHGAVFSGWIALLVIQASLAASSRPDIHRRLGIAGLVLAPCVVTLGILVANEMLRRLWAVPGFDARAIYAVALSQILGFAVPVTFAFGLHRSPAFHKRLILIGTIAMMTAAFGRWPVHFLLHKPLPAMIATFGLLLLLVFYDLLTMRRIHPATALGGIWVVFIELTAIAIGHTTEWQNLTGYIHSAAT